MGLLHVLTGREAGAPPAAPRSPARRLSANVRWVFIGNVAVAAGYWLKLVLLARSGGPAAVGTYSFALALTAPVISLASLQLGTLQASDARGAFAFLEYRRLRLVTTLGAMVALAAFAATTGGTQSTWAVFAPVCAMRAADTLAEVYYSAWQRTERMGILALGLVVNALGSVAFMAAALALGAGVGGAAAGAALGAGVALALVHARTLADAELRAAARDPAPLRWRRLGRLATQAIPLGVIVLLGSLQQNVPGYFVMHHAGAAALGVFTATTQLTAAGSVVVAALGGAAAPRLAALYAAGRTAAFRSLTLRLAAASFALGAAGVGLSAAVGRDVLVLLFRPEFGEGAPILVLSSVAAAFGFAAVLLGYALTAARVIWVQPVILSIVLAALAAACALLVPRHGGLGAAWGLVLASGVHALGSWIVLQRLPAAEAPPRGAASPPRSLQPEAAQVPSSPGA